MGTNFNIGVRLAIYKGFGVTHYGIYSGSGMVVDNSNVRGCVQERPLSEFAGGRQVRAVPINSKYLPHEVVERARSQKGKPYGWLSQNCEHFVNEIQLGVPKSAQALVGGSLLALVLYRLVSSK